MLFSTSTSAPHSPVVPSPALRKSPHQYHSMGVAFPLFSYSYALFCTAKNPNSFRFMFFRTLCTKHPGWGIPCFFTSVRSALKSIPICAPPDPSGTHHHLLVYPESRRAAAPLSPLVTILDAVDAASSISPAFATLTKNTRGGGLFDSQLSTARPSAKRRVNRPHSSLTPKRRSPNAHSSKMLKYSKGATRFRRKLSRPEGMPGPTCP
jgi:hypothetical protein